MPYSISAETSLSWESFALVVTEDTMKYNQKTVQKPSETCRTTRMAGMNVN